MIDEQAVRTRARTYYNRHWREWAQTLFEDGACTPELSVNLKPPRESDVTTSEAATRARKWAGAWRTCALPGNVDWQTRSWARIGNQSLPTRIRIVGAREIALWAGREREWDRATQRIADLNDQVNGPWKAFPKQSLGPAIKASIGDWQALDEADWSRALHVLEWLLSHPDEHRYVRQLPIRGIDTKWLEQHGKALRPLFYALTGRDFSFAKPAKQFRCKACCEETTLGGCSEFSLDAEELDALSAPPPKLLICENLVNTLCLNNLDGTLALHGSGFAVQELANIRWLQDTPILYWGDLDTNGFAILNLVRSFAPHTRSVMMDLATLNHHFDLCVEEPSPALGPFEHLTKPERETIDTLRAGDPTRNIATLRLEQERIEWTWVLEHLGAQS